MAVLGWPTIADTEIDGGSPIHEDLFAKFHQAQECLVTQAIDLFHESQNITTGFVKVAELFVPIPANSDAGDVEIVYRAEGMLASAGSVTITGALYTSGGVKQTEKTFAVTATAWGTFFELRFVDADTKAIVNDPGAELRLKASTVSPQASVRSLTPTSRVERIA